MNRTTHTIDAKTQKLGRIATQIAILLRGKHKPDFEPYKDMGDFVVVTNVRELAFSGNKMSQKIYYRHSGYLGGLKEKKLGTLFAERPAQVLRKAVWGMLPNNKLRSKQITRLKIS